MTTVLVVEDTVSEQDLIVGYLVESGYTVISASNGQDAIKKIDGGSAVATNVRELTVALT